MGTRQSAVLSKNIRRVSASLTRPANATAYTAGDAISAVTTNDHFTFTDALEGTRSATIDSLVITSSAQGVANKTFDLLLFSKDFTETADNAAMDITDAEALTCIGVINIPAASWVGLVSSSVCSVNNIGLDIQAGRTIYAQLRAAADYTPASSEVIAIEMMVANH